MKIYCECGYVIADSTDYIPHKANLTADQDVSDLYEGISAILEQFIQDPQQSTAPYPAAEKVRHASRKIAILLGNYQRHILYQCPDCGRLHLNDVGRRLHTFVPTREDVPRDLLRSVEGDRWKGPLRGNRSDTNVGEMRGWLWWRRIEGENGVEQFQDWESLQRRYYEVFARLQNKGILRDAALRKNAEVVHCWPS
jgi:hypothetical protein